MKKCKSNDAPKMAGCRSRNPGNGRLRQKREDTHVKTIEKAYKVDLGMRGDAHLGAAMKRFGVSSVSDLVEATRGDK